MTTAEGAATAAARAATAAAVASGLGAAEAAYYSSQSPFSDPGELAGAYAGLPVDAGELARIVRDLLIHRVESGQWGVPVAEDRMRNDAQTRYSDEGVTDEIRALYDRAAAVIAHEPDFAATRALFAVEDGLRTPRTVLSLAPLNGPARVTLR